MNNEEFLQTDHLLSNFQGKKIYLPHFAPKKCVNGPHRLKGYYLRFILFLALCFCSCAVQTWT